MAKVSIIIPIYNAEKYLKRCFESILKQNFGPYEIILVNDESLDYSKAIELDPGRENLHYNRAIAKVNLNSYDEVLEDYRDYCEEENLIDYTDDTLMVRLAGDTFDFNYENNVYYDGHSNNAHGFRYIGLYKKQRVQAIGKISKIIEAHIEGDEIKYNCYGDMISYVGKRIITDNEKRIIDLAIKDRQNRYENITVPHWHYIVEKFIHVENFKKQKGALMGKKKFYLKEDFEINDIKNCMIEDIAIAMNKKSDIWK